MSTSPLAYYLAARMNSDRIGAVLKDLERDHKAPLELADLLAQAKLKERAAKLLCLRQ